MNQPYEVVANRRVQSSIAGLVAMVGLKNRIHSVLTCKIHDRAHLPGIPGGNRAHEPTRSVSGQEVFCQPTKAVQNLGVEPGYPTVAIMRIGISRIKRDEQVI